MFAYTKDQGLATPGDLRFLNTVMGRKSKHPAGSRHSYDEQPD